MSFNRDAKQLHKDQVLEFLLHHMPMEQRYALGRALPEAYNDLCGRKVLRVVYADDGREV